MPIIARRICQVLNVIGILVCALVGAALLVPEIQARLLDIAESFASRALDRSLLLDRIRVGSILAWATTALLGGILLIDLRHTAVFRYLQRFQGSPDLATGGGLPEPREAGSVWLPAIGVLGSIVYVVLCLKYYLAPYFPPDVELYSNFQSIKMGAKDGFSSVFVQISAFVPMGYQFFSLLSLAFLALSQYFLYRASATILRLTTVPALLGLLFLLSLPVWYYVYGKLYYDFPFFCLSFSGAVFVASQLFRPTTTSKQVPGIFAASVFLLGLCMSWKLYSVFLIFGLGGLVLLYPRARRILIGALADTSVYLPVVAFLAGYFVGNYHVFTSPLSTLYGILAKPSHYDFLVYLTTDGRLLWDHVNNLSFGEAVTPLIPAATVLFVLPFLTKSPRYLALSALMVGLFAVFISRFSPGFAWNGFSFGLFIGLFLLFQLGEAQRLAPRRRFVVHAMSAALVAWLLATTLFSYLPRQSRWFEETERALNVYARYASDMEVQIRDLVERVPSGSTVKIEVPFKRRFFKTDGTVSLRYNGMYLWPDNVSAYDPQAAALSKSELEWEPSWVYRVDGPPQRDYTILVYPARTVGLSDVMPSPQWRDDQVLTARNFGDYSIVLISNASRSPAEDDRP